MNRIRKTSSLRQKNRHSRILHLLVGIGILIILALCAFWLYNSKLLKITTVFCETELGEPCSETINQDLRGLKSTPIVLFDHWSASTHLLRTHPARVTSLKKDLSGNLRLTIELDEPLYSILVDTSHFGIGRSGRSIELADTDDLTGSIPCIILNSSQLPFLQSRHEELLQFLQYAQQLGLTVNTISWLAPHELSVTFDQTTIPVIVDFADWQTNLSRAAAVLANASPSAIGSASYLDVRFDLPVLRNNLENPTFPNSE